MTLEYAVASDDQHGNIQPAAGEDIVDGQQKLGDQRHQPRVEQRARADLQEVDLLADVIGDRHRDRQVFFEDSQGGQLKAPAVRGRIGLHDADALTVRKQLGDARLERVPVRVVGLGKHVLRPGVQHDQLGDVADAVIGQLASQAVDDVLFGADDEQLGPVSLVLHAGVRRKGGGQREALRPSEQFVRQQVQRVRDADLQIGLRGERLAGRQYLPRPGIVNHGVRAGPARIYADRYHLTFPFGQITVSQYYTPGRIALQQAISESARIA